MLFNQNLTTEQKNVFYSKIFYALSSEVRINVLRKIVEADEQGIDINTATAFLPYSLPRSSMSHHVKILESANLINREKQGKDIFLTPNPTGISKIAEFHSELVSMDI